METIKILVAEDHDIVREGLLSLLAEDNTIFVKGNVSNGKKAYEFCQNNDIDIILMDINMPELGGVEATQMITKEFPEIKILATSMYDEEHHIRDMMRAGASGYFIKNDNKQELTKAIRKIYEGGRYFSDGATKAIMADLGEETTTESEGVNPDGLTAREKEVLALIAGELTNKEIADKLYLSVRTVDAHRRNLMQKIGARNTVGLVLYAIKYDITDY